jgi:hypothetical protein
MNKKKVLIVTYYWPPAGGPGVQRWLMFVKYLHEFGIEPWVYIPKNASYPFKDEELLRFIPKNVRIIKKSIFEPYKWAGLLGGKKADKISKGIIPDKKQSVIEKILLWIRGNLFIPDARKFWIKPSVSFLKKIIIEENIDIIITTGPPHSLHLIGYQLKKQLVSLKWISDFRDPWTKIGYHSKLKLSRYAARKHEKLERSVLQNSDTIIVTSISTKKSFEQITSKPIKVITNGYDGEVSSANQNIPQFTIAHIGSLLTGRDPGILWEVLKELVQENKHFAKDFKLVLAGVVSKEVLAHIYANDLKDYLEMPGYISHDEVRKLQQVSAVLLLIEIDSPDTKCIIPGKLFEYMVSGRPVLAIGPKGWDVLPFLTETNIGAGFAYNEKQQLKEKIVSYYQDFKLGKLRTSPENLEKYHRKSLTGELAKLIKTI